MVDYNKIGKSYHQTRKADSRITAKIVEGLQLQKPSVIADIGAGTGNYTYELAQRGHKLIAVEPSHIMRSQGKQHENIEWRNGVAEALPLESHSIDGIICTLATHHFSNLEQSFAEMGRVLKSNGHLVIFTNDPRECPKKFWFDEYFQEVVEAAYDVHLPIKEFTSLLEEKVKRNITVHRYPLPPDLSDKFFCSRWQNPEYYLDELFCLGISPLANASQEKLQQWQERLRNDLDSGVWMERYGHILNFDAYDCGYRFITTRNLVRNSS